MVSFTIFHKQCISENAKEKEQRDFTSGINNHHINLYLSELKIDLYRV